MSSIWGSLSAHTQLTLQVMPRTLVMFAMSRPAVSSICITGTPTNLVAIYVQSAMTAILTKKALFVGVFHRLLRYQCQCWVQDIARLSISKLLQHSVVVCKKILQNLFSAYICQVRTMMYKLLEAPRQHALQDLQDMLSIHQSVLCTGQGRMSTFQDIRHSLPL